MVFRGCIPGPSGCLVKLSDAIKKPWPEIATTGAQAEANPPMAPT